MLARCSLPCLALVSSLSVVAAPKPVTFYQDIAPLVYRECAPCHRPGESGPFPLLNYEDVKRHAAQIADVTKRRFMPPWLPEHGYGEFAEERRLSEEQIERIQEWVRQGSIAGSTARAPKPPAFSSEWQLGKPDLVLQIPHPYELGGEGPEVFWNFILTVPLKTSQWVKAIEVRPGNPRVFHHANVIIDRSHTARRLERIRGEGFPGMDVALEEETFDPDSHFLSWKPGSRPVVEPDGMAWRADPGMDLVLNVHLKRSGKTEIVNPAIGIYFTDKPRTKFAMLVQLERDSSIDVPPGEKDFVVTDDFRAPMDLTVLAVYPHAHYLARLMEGYATLPDGSRKWLVRIPDWDLNWQGVYRFKEPIALPRGSVVSMRYHYDNSTDNVRNPSNPPKEVRAGNLATDEMGHFWLQVLPVGEGDRRAVLEESLMLQRLEKYPADFSANYNIGDLLLSKGDAAGAIPYFERAWKTEPSSVVAATELGVALFGASRLPEAEQQLKRALGVDQKYTDARYDLASVQASSGNWEAAASQFRQVLTERPDDAKSWQHLVDVLSLWGEELVKAGDFERAAARFREAVVYRPKDAGLRMSLGAALARMGRMGEARTEFEAAVRIDPGFQAARRALAAMESQTGK